MNTEANTETLHDATRAKLRSLSKAFLRLHKILLENAKSDYEAANGAITGANHYLQLVIDDPHFAWLRKFSSLIALIDEATSRRRPATERDAQALIEEAKILLDFGNGDEEFNDKFQNALRNNSDAVLSHNDARRFVG